jgi:hypothetical protein
MHVAAEKKQASEQFDRQVTGRYGLLAAAAFSAKNQPAQYGQVVVERDRISAVRASGTRRYDGFATGQPVDTHVQEAAKTQPINEDRSFEKKFHVG